MHPAQREVRVGVVAIDNGLCLHLDNGAADRAGCDRLVHSGHVQTGLFGERDAFCQCGHLHGNDHVVEQFVDRA